MRGFVSNANDISKSLFNDIPPHESPLQACSSSIPRIRISTRPFKSVWTRRVKETLPSKAIFVSNIRNIEKLVLQNFSRSVEQGAKKSSLKFQTSSLYDCTHCYWKQPCLSSFHVFYHRFSSYGQYIIMLTTMFGTLFKVRNFNCFHFLMKLRVKYIFLSLLFVYNAAKYWTKYQMVFSGPSVVFLVRHGIQHNVFSALRWWNGETL